MTPEHKPHPVPVPDSTHPRADVLAEEYRGRYLWDELDKARERIAGLEEHLGGVLGFAHPVTGEQHDEEDAALDFLKQDA